MAVHYLVINLPGPIDEATALLNQHAADGWTVMAVSYGQFSPTVILERITPTHIGDGT